jgi:hypothetical protein
MLFLLLKIYTASHFRYPSGMFGVCTLLALLLLMNQDLLNKGRQQYIRLNKQFLDEVEKGTSWEELQPVVEQMKTLAVYLQQIPRTSEVIIPTPPPVAGEPPLAEPTPL